MSNNNVGFAVSKPIIFGEHKRYHQNEIENKIYPKGSKVLVVDGDTVAFRVASASDEKSILVTSPTGRKKKFKNRTEWKKWASENNLASANLDEYIITDVVDTEPLSFCLKTMKTKLEKLLRNSYAQYCELYFGGSENFRLDLPLPTQYKGQRNQVKPTYLKECQAYMVEKQRCKEVVGVETDDIVQQRIIQIAKAGSHPILATIDKDAFQVFDEVGYSIINISTDITTKHIGGFGKLYLKGNDLKGEGFVWLMSQVFLFDRVDNYIMNSHYLKQYGGKSFYKDFVNLDNHKDVLEKMKSLWLKLLPPLTKYTSWNGLEMSLTRMELAELYFSCAYMRLVDNDPRTLDYFFKKYGVSTLELEANNV